MSKQKELPKHIDETSSNIVIDASIVNLLDLIRNAKEHNDTLHMSDGELIEALIVAKLSEQFPPSLTSNY